MYYMDMNMYSPTRASGQEYPAPAAECRVRLAVFLKCINIYVFVCVRVFLHMNMCVCI